MVEAALLILFFGGFIQAAGVPPSLPQIDPAAYPPEIREPLSSALRAVVLAPNDPTAVGRFAMLLHAHDQLQLASETYDRAAALSPDAFEWIYLAGVTRERRGEYGEAASRLRRATELRPGYPAARFRLAEALVASGELDQSGRLYEGLTGEPGFGSVARYGLGRIQAARGNFAPAVAHLREAVRLHGDFGAALYMLALAYRGLGQREEAQAALAAYEQHRLGTPPVPDPVLDSVRNLVDRPVDRVRRATELERAGRATEAIAELERALQMDPSLVQARVNLISLYGRSGQAERAEEQYRAGLAIDANLPELHYNYGVLLVSTGREGDAAIAFERALALNPGDAKTHNNLGQLLERKSQPGAALEHYQQAIHHDPASRVARFNLGRMLVATGRPLDAVKEFELLLSPEDDDTPRYTFALAAAYARAGRREEARRYGNAALELARRKGQMELAASIERDLERLKP
jgi:tetratricopeptide (TPR) repeat protein